MRKVSVLKELKNTSIEQWSPKVLGNNKARLRRENKVQRNTIKMYEIMSSWSHPGLIQRA